MKIILIVIIAFLSGCSALQQKKSEKEQYIYGAWRGKIKQITTKKLPIQEDSEIYEVIVLACNEIPEFWLKMDESGFHKNSSPNNHDSKSGNILYYELTDGGGWVETQSWTIVAINEQSAAIQWNRMVSNPGLGVNEELRSFGQLGYGSVQKISNSCDIWGK